MDVDAPDVKRIALAEAELRPSSLRAEEADSSFAILVAQSTWDAIQAHAHTRLDAEVGGVLLGKICRDARETPYLLIDGYVAALEAESRSSNVTFTGESWTKIHEAIDRDHAGAAIVGWYHTHPSFGIFLSEMDVFIHRHFFEAPHQVAVVIDPVANTHGGFAWRAGVPEPQRILVEADDAQAGAPRTGVDFRASFRRREQQRGAASTRLGRTLKFLFTLLACVAAFVLCFYALMQWTPLSIETQPKWPYINFGQ